MAEAETNMINIYVAVLIKATSFHHLAPILSIDYIVSSDFDGIIESKRINMNVNYPVIDDNGEVLTYGDFPPDDWNSYWSGIDFTEYKENAMSQIDGIELFINFIDRLETTYPENTHIIKFVVRDYIYGWSHLNHWIDEYHDRMHAEVSSSGTIRQVIAPSIILDAIHGTAYRKRDVAYYMSMNINQLVREFQNMRHSQYFLCNIVNEAADKSLKN